MNSKGIHGESQATLSGNDVTARTRSSGGALPLNFTRDMNFRQLKMH